MQAGVGTEWLSINWMCKHSSPYTNLMCKHKWCPDVSGVLMLVPSLTYGAECGAGPNAAPIAECGADCK